MTLIVPAFKPLVAFTAVNSSIYGTKLMKGGSIPLSAAVSTEEDTRVEIDEYGEEFKFNDSGLYRFILDVEITKVNGKGALRIKRGRSEETLAFIRITRLGKKHVSTIIEIEEGEVISIIQTEEMELEIAPASVKLSVYKVGSLRESS